MKPSLTTNADTQQNKTISQENLIQQSTAAILLKRMGMAACIALLVLLAFSFTACKEKKEKKDEARSHGHGHGDGPGSYEYISKDTANKMLSSYLVSINSTENDTDLRSLIINADTLRAYLADTNIKDIKIMMAHTLSYINSGGLNHPCGYDARDLTFIIAGYSYTDNYIYYTTKSVPITPDVINHGMPCPSSCPPYGTAASDLLE
jgi:hypothetical protein